MGASVSTQVANQTTAVVNKAMTNLVNKSTSSASAVSVNANDISLDLTGANIEDCELNFTQMVKATQTVKCMAKFTSVSDMKQQMKAALQNQVEQENKQKMEALSFSLGVSTGVQNINQAINNYVETNITNETYNDVSAHMVNNNKIEIKAKGLKMKCTGGKGRFVIDQEIIAAQTAELLTDAIMENINDNVTDAKSDTKGKQKSDQVIEGIKGVISALGLTIMLPLFICMGLVLVIMGPGLIKGMSAKKGKFFFGSRLRKIRFGGGRRW